MSLLIEGTPGADALIEPVEFTAIAEPGSAVFGLAALALALAGARRLSR